MERTTGLGIDIVGVDRVRRLLVDHFDRVMEDVYCTEELYGLPKFSDAAFRSRDPVHYYLSIRLAQKFAAKEATVKALSIPISLEFTLRDIAIRGLDRFAVGLSPTLKEWARSKSITRLFGSAVFNMKYVIATVMGVSNECADVQRTDS